jgi:hypothetical protein
MKRPGTSARLRASRSVRSLVPAFTRCAIVVGAVIGAAGSSAFGQCEVGKIGASDAAENADFGIQVSLDRNVLLAGAAADSGGDPVPGAVYVFRFDGTSWNQEAKLTASDGEPGDRFGTCSVSGNVAVIGAYLDDHAGGVDAGSAYVFRFNGTNWTEQVKLTASDADADDWFGIITSVADDIALIASPRDDDAGENAGAVYVYRFDGTNWIEGTKLVPADAEAGDSFGYPVVLSRCGTLAIIGSYGNDDAGENAGAAYVYRFDGTSWGEEDKLTASDAEPGDLFGLSAFIDGDVAIVASLNDDRAGAASGSAYVFRFDGTGWTEEAKLTASDGAEGDNFGSDVCIRHDVAVVSAVNDDDGGENSGSAYVFRFDGTSWVERAKLTASDAAAGDWFGNAVSLQDDVLAVGARWDDDGGEDSGSAYVFAGLLGVDYNGNGVADVCESLCPADTDGDGDVDTADLLALLAAWGECP